MSRGTNPGARDGRAGRNGRALGVAHARRREEVPAPELRPGQVRCPVCRKGVSPTSLGSLRSHLDLFGHPCYNKRPPEPEIDPHAFEVFDGASGHVCTAMVMRNGGGDACGLPADHPAHEVKS